MCVFLFLFVVLHVTAIHFEPWMNHPRISRLWGHLPRFLFSYFFFFFVFLTASAVLFGAVVSRCGRNVSLHSYRRRPPPSTSSRARYGEEFLKQWWRGLFLKKSVVETNGIHESPERLHYKKSDGAALPPPKKPTNQNLSLPLSCLQQTSTHRHTPLFLAFALIVPCSEGKRLPY